MFDRILEAFVVIGPTAFAITVEIVSEKVRKDPFWKWGVAVFGIALSALTYWQIGRQEKSASVEQKQAVERVSAEVTTNVTASVTKAVGEQYQGIVKNLTDQIGVLKGQLESQGKKVDVISNSNIVTGKSPIKVELTGGPSLSGQTPLEIRASELPVEPNPQYGKAAREIILTTNRVMNGAHASIHCLSKINNGTAQIAGTTTQMGGGGMGQNNTFEVDIDAPNWAPSHPLVVTIFFDGPDWKGCTITPRN